MRKNNSMKRFAFVVLICALLNQSDALGDEAATRFSFGGVNMTLSADPLSECEYKDRSKRHYVHLALHRGILDALPSLKSSTVWYDDDYRVSRSGPTPTAIKRMLYLKDGIPLPPAVGNLGVPSARLCGGIAKVENLSELFALSKFQIGRARAGWGAPALEIIGGDQLQDSRDRCGSDDTPSDVSKLVRQSGSLIYATSDGFSLRDAQGRTLPGFDSEGTNAYDVVNGAFVKIPDITAEAVKKDLTEAMNALPSGSLSDYERQNSFTEFSRRNEPIILSFDGRFAAARYGERTSNFKSFIVVWEISSGAIRNLYLNLGGGQSFGSFHQSEFSADGNFFARIVNPGDDFDRRTYNGFRHIFTAVLKSDGSKSVIIEPRDTTIYNEGCMQTTTDSIGFDHLVSYTSKNSRNEQKPNISVFWREEKEFPKLVTDGGQLGCIEVAGESVCGHKVNIGQPLMVLTINGKLLDYSLFKRGSESITTPVTVTNPTRGGANIAPNSFWRSYQTFSVKLPSGKELMFYHSGQLNEVATLEKVELRGGGAIAIPRDWLALAPYIGDMTFPEAYKNCIMMPYQTHQGAHGYDTYYSLSCLRKDSVAAYWK